jgi:hypothetical protein
MRLTALGGSWGAEKQKLPAPLPNDVKPIRKGKQRVGGFVKQPETTRNGINFFYTDRVGGSNPSPPTISSGLKGPLEMVPEVALEHLAFK